MRNLLNPWFTLCSLTIVFGCTPKDPEPTFSHLDERVDSLITADVNSPGSAILVMKDGEIILNRGYGLANLEHNIPITLNTVFDLASLSKQFTGYAISLLVEQGKLDLKDDIRQYIPELQDFGSTITIDHLLHHTSGIRDWTSTLPLSGLTFDDVISFEEILQMAYNQKELNFEPGSEYLYSNTGYNLLAELIQRVTGKSFSDWTKENIFQPLNMEHTFFLGDHHQVINNRASGYYLGNDGHYYVSPNSLTALGSSSMYSTTADLAKWVMHLHKLADEGSSIYSRMLQKGVLNNGEEISYAFGLETREFNKSTWVAHSGGWASFSTYLVIIPEHDLSIVVLNNHQGNPYQIALSIASLMVPDPSPSDNAEEAIESEEVMIASDKLSDYEGTYRLGPGWYVNITRQGEELWTRATGEENYPMTALSDSVFSIKDYGNRTMTFVHDDSGQVSHMIYMGQKRQKVEPYEKPGPEMLADYNGEYFSEELFATYSVFVEGDNLRIKHHRHGVHDLNYAWKDDFSGSLWFMNSVEFGRDEAGKVSGFVVNNFRARNQQFVKVDNL